MMSNYFNLVDRLGRFLAASLFLGSGYDHITNWPKSLAMVASRGLPAPILLLGVSVIVELAGAACLILGWNMRIATLALAALSILATRLFYAVFGIEAELHMFTKDVALAGALLCLAVRVPGPFRLDGR